jgi:hypothetical protein
MLNWLQVIIDFENTPMYRLWFFVYYSCSFVLLLVVRRPDRCVGLMSTAIESSNCQSLLGCIRQPVLAADAADIAMLALPTRARPYCASVSSCVTAVLLLGWVAHK